MIRFSFPGKRGMFYIRCPEDEDERKITETFVREKKILAKMEGPTGLYVICELDVMNHLVVVTSLEKPIVILEIDIDVIKKEVIYQLQNRSVS